MQCTSFMKVFMALILSYAIGFGQVRDYRIHERGMIRETLYNTGTISRPWIVNEWPTKPMFVWPKNSETTIEGKYYNGHHMSHGAGVYVSANLRSKHTEAERLYAFCGGTGERTLTQKPFLVYSFPISINKIENFPVLEDGLLNPNYNPDEAEEIIIAKWATSVGITITRTTRSWSYPNYDDMIIYEYVLEYTGDTDGDTTTIEFDHDGNGLPDEDLVDVLFHINWSCATSMLGFNRWYPAPPDYNIGWAYDATDGYGLFRQDLRWSFDPDYWLLWNTTTHTTSKDHKREWWAFKPEPDPELFIEFAETGLNGGGLLGAACPGYAMLYWDTNHLANVNPDDPDRDPTIYNLLTDETGNYYEFDEDGHIKQPWNLKTATPRSSVVKVKDRACDMDERWWSVYGKVGKPSGVPSDRGLYVLPDGSTWKGRARFEWYETYNGSQCIHGFGPYILEPGDKLEFACAQVVGYGATSRKVCLGGQQQSQFAPVREMDRPVTLEDKNGNPIKMTDHYLTDYGYPDFVNSNVITVNQVAHKAHEAYLGREILYDGAGEGPADGMIFPEMNPRPSDNPMKYQIPIPVPAPAIITENTQDGKVLIKWNRVVEKFSHNRLMAALDKFYIFRSLRACGPWTLLDSLQVGDVTTEDMYIYEDSDAEFRLGTSRYYAVTSVDENGDQSGKTNIIQHQKEIGGVKEFGKVHVVPNPFYIESGFQEAENKIKFYGLPKKCTIRIFSFSGQLVQTIEHDVDFFSDEWFQVTRNNQDIASGVYFYVVTTPSGEKTSGKFTIIK